MWWRRRRALVDGVVGAGVGGGLPLTTSPLDLPPVGRRTYSRPHASGEPHDLKTATAPRTCCVWRKALSKTRLSSYSNTLYDHTSRVQVNPRATCAHTAAHQRPRLHGSPINTTPHHDIAAPRTHTFPDTARRDALYEPTNLTNLLRHHEHGRAEGGRERRRGGEEGQAGAAEVRSSRRAIRRGGLVPSGERTSGGLVELQIVLSDRIRGRPDKLVCRCWAVVPSMTRRGPRRQPCGAR